MEKVILVFFPNSSCNFSKIKDPKPEPVPPHNE
jgi:hypothetical protein